MADIHYQQSADGIHILTVEETQIENFSTGQVTDRLGEIHHFAYGKPAFILLDLTAHYRLPLREFVSELKQFYQSIDGSNLMIALVVQASMVRVLETMVKTMVTRESIQYFTDADRAYMWLQLEHKKRAA